MHEIHDIEFDLWDDAERLGKKYGGAPVVIIVAGYEHIGSNVSLEATLESAPPGKR